MSVFYQKKQEVSKKVLVLYLWVKLSDSIGTMGLLHYTFGEIICRVENGNTILFNYS